MKGNPTLSTAAWALVSSSSERTHAIQKQIHDIEYGEIGELNHRLEQARLALRALEMSEQLDSGERATIDAHIQEYEALYQVQNKKVLPENRS